MGRIIYGIIAAIASFMLPARCDAKGPDMMMMTTFTESLTCNKCTVGLVGVCLNQAEETCSTNTSVCFTGRATFPSISSFVGFNTQGCSEPDFCNGTTNGTLLGVTFLSATTCCSEDNCNPVVITSGAPSAKLSLSAVLSAGILASVWGSLLN